MSDIDPNLITKAAWSAVNDWHNDEEYHRNWEYAKAYAGGDALEVAYLWQYAYAMIYEFRQRTGGMPSRVRVQLAVREFYESGEER